MGYTYDKSPFAPLRTTTSGTSLPDKDAEIARLRAEVERLRGIEAAAKADRDDVIRRNAQLVSDLVPLDEAIAHLASYCHARGYAEDCAAMQQPGSRSKFAATLWRVLGNAHADRRFLLSELDSARAALAKEREACDRWRSAAPKDVQLSDGITSPHWMVCIHGLAVEAVQHDARRAAEAKEPPHA